MTVNKVIIVGRLGADPELRYTNAGQAVCKMSVATNRHYTDAAGERREETAWHRVTTWGKHGELCRNYLSKGRQVFVEGRLHHSSYTDKEGTKRFSTEIVSNVVQFLDSPAQRASEPTPTFSSASRAAQQGESHDDQEDDIPF